MTRFERTTVVWCDGSPASLRAVAAATREAARRGTGLVLLCWPGRCRARTTGARRRGIPVVEERSRQLVATDASVPLEVVVAGEAPRA